MGLGEILIRYLLEAVKFSLGNEIFCKKRQNYRVLLLGAAACVPLWFLLREYVPFFMRFFAYLELRAFVFGSLRCPVRERCAAFLKIYLLMVVCDSLIDIPWELRGMEQSIGWEDALFIDVIQNLIIILLLCLIYIGRECLPESMQRAFGRFAERYLPAAGGGAVFLLLLLLTGLDIAISGTEDVYTRQILGIVREGGAVGAGLLGLLLSAVWASRERLLLIRQQQDRYLQKQQEYYELLLEKEQDTRAYRHDMQRHLMNLYALQKEEKEVQAQVYLRGLYRKRMPAGKYAKGVWEIRGALSARRRRRSGVSAAVAFDRAGYRHIGNGGCLHEADTGDCPGRRCCGSRTSGALAVCCLGFPGAASSDPAAAGPVSAKTAGIL